MKKNILIISVVIFLLILLVFLFYSSSKDRGIINNFQNENNSPNKYFNVSSEKENNSNNELIASQVPVLKNFGIRINPLNKTSNMAGDFLFEDKNYVDDKIFTEFGHKIVNDRGEKFLPEIGFNVPVGTKIVSPMEGIVSAVSFYEPSQDYIVSLKISEDSPWIVGFEHVYNVHVKVGDKVIAGQELAEVSPSYGNSDFGNVELNVWVGGQSVIKYCPFDFLDNSLKTIYKDKINQLAQEWEIFIGKNVYNQEEWVSPGCLFHNLKEF